MSALFVPNYIVLELGGDEDVESIRELLKSNGYSRTSCWKEIFHHPTAKAHLDEELKKNDAKYKCALPNQKVQIKYETLDDESDIVDIKPEPGSPLLPWQNSPKRRRTTNPKSQDDDVPQQSDDQVPQLKPKRIRTRKIAKPLNLAEFQLFEGTKVTAKKGKHPALLYRKPGDENHIYTFQFQRKNKNKPDVYACVSCKSNKEKKSYVRIEVIGTQFLSDPAALSHVCQPPEYSAQIATRKLYEVTQDLRSSPTDAQPHQIYRTILANIETDATLNKSERDAIVLSLGSYKKKRKVISTAVNSNRHR